MAVEPNNGIVSLVFVETSISEHVGYLGTILTIALLS